MSKKVALFVDVSNIYYCVGKKFHRKVDYLKYLNAAIGEHSLYRAYAYGAQINDEASRFLTCLRSFGYEIRYKKPKLFDNPEYRIDLMPLERLIENSKDDVTEAKTVIEQLNKVLKAKKDTIKADWDVGIALDVVRIADRVDTIVLGSADSDLAPLVEWVKDQGCRCEIFACNVSKELRDVADAITEIDTNVF